MAIPVRSAAIPSAPPFPHPSLPDRPCTTFCYLIRCLVITLVVVGAGGWLIYLWNMNAAYYPEFKVESATVSQLNTEGSTISATWDITLVAVNPNRKFKTSFDLVHAGVGYYYGDTVIELVSTPRFRRHFALKEMNQTRFDFKIGVERLMIGDAVAQKISYDRSRGSVRFAVTMDILRVKFKATLAPTLEDQHRVGVTCDQVAFEFSGNNGTGVQTSQSSCSVYFD